MPIPWKERWFDDFAVGETAVFGEHLVSEDEILSVMRSLRQSQGWLMEGAAAVALAAFLKQPQRYEGKNVVVVICGGNVSPEVMRRLT